MFGFNLGFDQTKYLIEQKKQVIESKARKTLQEEEERKKKQKEKEEIKKVIETTTNNINKIQINFHNSFVNKETQKTYDQIIEQNNKCEYDNIINNQNILLDNSTSCKIIDPEKEVILMETYSQCNNKTILEESSSSLVNDTTNNLVNMSSTIKEESDEEGYGKEEFVYNDNENNENDELFYKEEYLDFDKEDNDIDDTELKNKVLEDTCEYNNVNNKEGNGEISQSVCFKNEKVCLEDFNYKENEEKNNAENVQNIDNTSSLNDNKIVFKNYKIGAIFQPHLYLNSMGLSTNEKNLQTQTLNKENDNLRKIDKEFQETSKVKDASSTINDEYIDNQNSYKKTTYEIPKEIIEKNIKQELNKEIRKIENNEIKKEDVEDIPEEIEIIPDKFNYNKFLEESLNDKNDIQIKLREEMKRIILNINGREKEKIEMKKDKINAVLQNLSNFETYSENVDHIVNNKANNNKDLIEYSKRENFIRKEFIENAESLRNLTDSLTNDKLPKNIPFLLENPKFTFQFNFNQETSEEEQQINEQQDIIEDFAKKYEEEIKLNIEKEGYPINENYLKNQIPVTLLNNPNKTSTIDKIIGENNIVENIFDYDLTNIGSCQKEDLNQEDDNNLFRETNIINNETIKINEILENMKKVKKEEPIEDKRDQLIVFDNFKDTQEFKLKQKKLEKIREKKIKQAELLKEKMNMIMKESNINVQPIEEKKVEKSSNTCINYINQNYGTPVHKKEIHSLAQSKITENNPKQYQDQSKATPIHNKDSNIKKNKVMEQTPKHKSDMSNSSISDVQRTPVVIKRDESLKANKVIKQSNFKYNKLSNKNTVKSAITQVLLAGEVNKACREKILPIIDNCPCNNYIILFKGNTSRFDLKGIYTFDQQTLKVELLTCLTNSPLMIDISSIKNYYKYDIIQKEFKQLQETKQLSLIVDAVMLNSTKNS